MIKTIQARSKGTDPGTIRLVNTFGESHIAYSEISQPVKEQLSHLMPSRFYLFITFRGGGGGESEKVKKCRSKLSLSAMKNQEEL